MAVPCCSVGNGGLSSVWRNTPDHFSNRASYYAFRMNTRQIGMIATSNSEVAPPSL
jgi:hypothetical protein